MLFLTNRPLKTPLPQPLPREVSFDLSQNAASQEVYFCIRKKQGDYREIGSKKFFYELQHSQYQQILLYVHGFNNLPEEDIFPRVSLLQNYFDEQSHLSTQVVPIIWPCDNDLGIIKDYWDDKAAADMSGFAFQRALTLFYYWSKNQISNPCYKFINVITHSMGARVLRETLSAWKKYNLYSGLPLLFRNSFLVAPDISYNNLEEGNRGHCICDTSRNVVIYHANDDLALSASKVMAIGNANAGKRLGHAGPKDIHNIPRNVYSVDCDSINNEYDPPLGHAYFLPMQDKDNLMLQHLCSMLVTGRFANSNNDENNFIKL